MDRARLASIDYTNYKGVRKTYKIMPLAIHFSNSEFHPEPQWLLLATDIEREVLREFAMTKIHSWDPLHD